MSSRDVDREEFRGRVAHLTAAWICYLAIVSMLASWVVGIWTSSWQWGMTGFVALAVMFLSGFVAAVTSDYMD